MDKIMAKMKVLCIIEGKSFPNTPKLACLVELPSCFVKLRMRMGTIKLLCPRRSTMFA